MNSTPRQRHQALAWPSGSKSQRLTLLVLLAVLVGSVGCDSAELQDPPEADRRPLTSAEMAVVESGRVFGLNLFSRLNDASPDSNVVVAPLSVSMALGMAVNGAEANTHAEIIGALAPGGLTEDEINDGFTYLLSFLPRADNDVTVNVANSVWYRDGYAMSSAYLDRVQSVFSAKIDALDFAGPNAPTTINAWVSQATNGLIPTIVDAIPPEAVAYLINAVYFNGAWSQPFDADDTIQAEFANLDGSTSTVPMMQYRGVLRQYRDESVRAVDLAYGDSLYSMTILIPAGDPDNSSIVDVLTDFGEDELTAITDGLSASDAALALPRFTVSYSIELNDALRALGINDAFDEASAAFGRINPNDQLYISSVVHKTKVAVTEEGTEAAAATSVEVGVTSLPEPFRVDRPFAFFIRERHTGTLLFTGKVVAL